MDEYIKAFIRPQSKKVATSLVMTWTFFSSSLDEIDGGDDDDDALHM